jgi:hypothetical protein
MKLNRIQCLELLAALRSLDGITSGGVVTAFTFKSEVVDRIVQNILVLKTVAEGVEAYRAELAKLHAIDQNTSPTAPKVAEANAALGLFMAEVVEVEVAPLSKDDLNTKANAIPVSVRERLALIEPATD